MFKLHHPLYAFVLCAPVLLAQDGGQVQAPQAEKPVTNLDAQEGEYFATCDYDENGWISYREAEASLHLNRDGFAQYDADNNGQVTRDEFNTRYRLLLKRVGSFRIPTPESVTQVPVGAVPLSMQPVTALPNTSQAFVGLYDKDVNGMLNLAELTSASTALGFPGIPPTAILAKLDLNKNGSVEPPELEGVLAALHILDAASLVSLGAKAGSIEELFGGTTPRPYFTGGTPQPPTIKGPVLPFRRLDLDNDGFIDVDDLEQLSLSAHTVVRPSAILAGLDRDADGKLSPEELLAAFDG